MGMLLVCVSQVGTVVWCIGIDGHVAIESSSNGQCIPASAQPLGSQNTSGIQSASSASCCGVCLDIKINIDQFLVVSFVRDVPVSLAFQSTTLLHGHLIASDAASVASICKRLDMPPDDGCLPMHRTVVLRI